MLSVDSYTVLFDDRLWIQIMALLRFFTQIASDFGEFCSTKLSNALTYIKKITSKGFDVSYLSTWCAEDHTSKSIWESNPTARDLLQSTNQPTPVNISEIISKSESFPIKFPIESVRCKSLQERVSPETLEKYANSVYPVIHEKILELCATFLLHKIKAGSEVEKRFYKHMKVTDLINRLLSKRAVAFLGCSDSYLLLNGVRGAGSWESIGTDEEQSPLLLENCLSYEEVKLSAFLSVASYTHFLNDGTRKNRGVYTTDRSNIESEGIIIGLIGPRLGKPEVMDCQEIIRNDKKKYDDATTIFFDFYQEDHKSYEELIQRKVSNPSRFEWIEDGDYIFDNIIYSKRIAISVDTFLFEANQRAKERNTTAFSHLVGIGLGVWKISDHQNQLFADTCVARIKQLGRHLYNVSDVCFAYICVNQCGKYRNGDIIPIEGHPKGGIKVVIEDRQPHEKLKGADEGKLLVVSYAWDGNALPGNEFWKGFLCSSSDPAAASSTQVAELHNPHINPRLSADSLRIVTSTGVLTIQEYQQKVFSAK